MSWRGTALLFTDGCHPTVNASTRLPVHHARFVELLSRAEGVLNEFPRRLGGTAVRIPEVTDTGVVPRVIVTPRQWIPWWYPGDDQDVFALLADIYSRAIRVAPERRSYRAVRDRLRDAREARSTGKTLGEIVATIMAQLCGDVLPPMPKLDLRSLTRAPERSALAEGLGRIRADLIDVLSAWAARDEMRVLPLVAVGGAAGRAPFRVRFHATSQRFDAERLPIPELARRPGRGAQLCPDELIACIAGGEVIPGGRLVALAEVALSMDGWSVRHFGNTYGNVQMAAELLGAKLRTRIAVCDDDRDSWVMADLPVHGGGRYPVHVLDLLDFNADSERVSHLLAESLSRKGPVRLERPGDLRAAVSH